MCFADKVAGVWQGGSGLAKTGFTPITPGYQGQCTRSSYATHAGSCCANDFCEECKYWPLYPKTCAWSEPKRKLIDCIHAYTNDNIACGTDYYMWEAMMREGNDARLLSFAPGTPTSGGHRDPHNSYAWVVGCLGLADACSAGCEASFATCTTSAGGNPPEQFETCETDLKAGNLANCVVGCAPTLPMLLKSETPTVSLGEGKFGRTSGLTVTTAAAAPLPNCDNAFGNFGTGAVSNGCSAPGGTTFPNPAVFPDTSTCVAPILTWGPSASPTATTTVPTALPTASPATTVRTAIPTGSPTASPPGATKVPTAMGVPTHAPTAGPNAAPTSGPRVADGGDASASRKADEGPSPGELVGIIFGILGGAVVVLVSGLAIIAVVVARLLKKTAVVDEKSDRSVEQDGVQGIELGAPSASGPTQAI